MRERERTHFIENATSCGSQLLIPECLSPPKHIDTLFPPSESFPDIWIQAILEQNRLFRLNLNANLKSSIFRRIPLRRAFSTGVWCQLCKSIYKAERNTEIYSQGSLQTTLGWQLQDYRNPSTKDTPYKKWKVCMRLGKVGRKQFNTWILPLTSFLPCHVMWRDTKLFFPGNFVLYSSFPWQLICVTPIYPKSIFWTANTLWDGQRGQKEMAWGGSQRIREHRLATV